MNIPPEKLQRLNECVNVLDQAASAARTDRQSHVNAQIAVTELREHLAQFVKQPETPARTGG